MGGPIPNPFASKPSAPSPTPAPAPAAPAPTTSEVSQSSAADAVQPVKRRRGKSPSILTDALGNAGSAPTESKTLLGS